MSDKEKDILFNNSVRTNREAVIHALTGELPTGDGGYAPAGAEECRDFVVALFDEIIKKAKVSAHEARALEWYIKDSNIPYDRGLLFYAMDQTKIAGDE